MCPEEKYGWLFEMIDISPIVRLLGKKTTLGAPESLNYRAMVYSLFIRIVERMPFVKDLVYIHGYLLNLKDYRCFKS